MAGYLFQCRFALLESLRRLRHRADFTVSIETLDDVVFDTPGTAVDLLQTKHHLNRTADLSDGSVDLWKTIRVWCEVGLATPSSADITRFLITTASISPGSAASYLCVSNRDVDKATTRLVTTATSSTNQSNNLAYAAFLTLSPDSRKALLDSVYVIPETPSVSDVEADIEAELYLAVDPKFLPRLREGVEGWWNARVVSHLCDAQRKPILSAELHDEVSRLRDQYRDDNLPIDDDILKAEVDSMGFADRTFVHQLRLIQIGNPRIVTAIRNYFRAFQQRSRWISDDLLLVGELERYEDRLVEEWQLRFDQMKDDLGEAATDPFMLKEAAAIYKWVENHLHPQIRARCEEAFVSRGTYQMLADNQRVGWHPEFSTRLKHLLEKLEAAP